MPSLRAIRPLDLLALLLAIGAGITGLVVWDHGTVSLGLTLEYREERVRIADVTPDGNASRNYLFPSFPVLDITTVDGSPVERGSSIEEIAEEFGPGFPAEGFEHYEEIYYGMGVEPVSIGSDHRLPVEPVEPARIERLIAGDLDPECCIGLIGVLDRGTLVSALEQSIWTSAIGLLIGLLLWRLLAHGLAGGVGRRFAVIAAAGAATPFLVVPAVHAGTAAGIAAGYLLPMLAALLLGLGLATVAPDRQWSGTARVAALVAVGLMAVVVVRYLTSPSLQPGDRTSILLLMAAIGVVPAVIASFAARLPARDRISLVTLGLLPAAAATLMASNDLGAPLPIGLVGGLVVVQAATASAGSLGLGRGMRIGLNQRLERLRERAATTHVPPSDPTVVATRDRLTYGLIGSAVLISLMTPIGGPLDAPNPLLVDGVWPIVAGVGLATVVGLAIRAGFLGQAWVDAAVPLAAAVGVPILLVNGLSYYGRTPWAVVPTALAALSVAHILAVRHEDPVWRTRLFAVSAALVGLITLLSLANVEAIATVLIGLVALVPGMIAFADESGEPRAMTSRLETLAVALTPGFGATMLVPSLGLLLLGGWLVAIVVWRQFTLEPMLGLARRTQLQRDVAVAAAETERARLAADLHDDALQQLTMLVRTLDEKGQKEEADEAREIATKLRSVVGDLRLPILDDLGAGAALEWLVERVEPLAGGTVKLERSDETRPPANVELAVFRVAQEALTNAIKHGKPPIAVRYDVRTDGRVTLAIDDAGEGIGSEAADEAPKEGHFGLVNMQQRAEQIGALLDVRRWPAGGTRVALEWRPQ